MEQGHILKYLHGLATYGEQARTFFKHISYHNSCGFKLIHLKFTLFVGWGIVTYERGVMPVHIAKNIKPLILPLFFCEFKIAFITVVFLIVNTKFTYLLLMSFIL